MYTCGEYFQYSFLTGARGHASGMLAFLTGNFAGSGKVEYP